MFLSENKIYLQRNGIMSPIVQLYWIRVALGLVAALLSAIVAFYIGASADGLSVFVDALTIALIVYLGSYYPLRAMYKDKVEKPSKILSTAIFMYFMVWLPFMVLFYTTIRVYF
jgi:hypothetical protein